MRQVPKWLYVALACSVATVALAVTGLTRLSGAAEEELPVIKSAPAFALIDQDGASFTAEDLRGKVYLTSFIFTNCTDICPGITLQMRALQERFRQAGLLGDPVVLLSISVDPQRDTPEVLRQYAAQYQADTATWRFGTGDPAHIQQVVQEGFLLPAQRSEHSQSHGDHGGGQDYMVMHSDRLALVDQNGQIRAYYSMDDVDPERLIRDIKTLRRP